jgi:hypothetical protein
MVRAGMGILASACDRMYADRYGDIAFFTVCGDFAPSGGSGKTRLVEFTDDPGP